MTQQVRTKHNRLELKAHVTCALILLLILLVSACGDDSNQTQQTVSEFGEIPAPQIEVDPTSNGEDISRAFLKFFWRIVVGIALLLVKFLAEVVCLTKWWLSSGTGIYIFINVVRNRTSYGYRYTDTLSHTLGVALIAAISSAVFVFFISLLFCMIR